MKRKWLVISTLLFSVILILLLKKVDKNIRFGVQASRFSLKGKDSDWTAPDSNLISREVNRELILYGRKLVGHTSIYFGPSGIIGREANGMNCQNCHLDAGTRAWAGNFGGVFAAYPRFSSRKDGPETIFQRIADCFERSLNGSVPDSNGLEMRALHAYICWVGSGVEKGNRPPGANLELLPFMSRPADPRNGGQLYKIKCIICHGMGGQGLSDNAGGFLYPPLWGARSYNTAAGMYRLTKLAGFIKNSMPYRNSHAPATLNNEEAWDLAAFINSQPRPVKIFKQDWPNLLLKPIDYPVGPYADTFSSVQHKYGPFNSIAGNTQN